MPQTVLVIFMKKTLLALLSVALLATVGCRRSDKTETSVKTPSPEEAARLKSDSERLQQATANAAKARENAAATSSTASPTATP